MIPLSILDLSVVTTGTRPAAALRNSIDLARHADALGYVRYWLAEHHNLASVASPAPDLMIGQIAAVTKNIRVGSGGVMLPNHAPLIVAERFKMLEALFPGRIDLGLGRPPGNDAATAYALPPLQQGGGDARRHAAAADLAARLQRLQLGTISAGRHGLCVRSSFCIVRRGRCADALPRAPHAVGLGPGAARHSGGCGGRRRDRCRGRAAGVVDGSQSPAPRPRPVSA